MTNFDARVVAVCRDHEHRFSKISVDEIVLMPGLGVQGDAHSRRDRPAPVTGRSGSSATRTPPKWAVVLFHPEALAPGAALCYH